MATPLTPSRALAELAEQHARLRERMDRCEELADGLDAGRIEPAQLLREVAQLRLALDAHNQFEEALLRPVLLDADWLGAVRVSRMVEDHTREHRAMGHQLASPATPTSELRATIAGLRAHLDGEETYFLTRRVLRDDLVR
jgi:iron-sulfur cluster repair protein YtfE (RIC family)